MVLQVTWTIPAHDVEKAHTNKRVWVTEDTRDIGSERSFTYVVLANVFEGEVLVGTKVLECSFILVESVSILVLELLDIVNCVDVMFVMNFQFWDGLDDFGRVWDR